MEDDGKLKSKPDPKTKSGYGEKMKTKMEAERRKGEAAQSAEIGENSAVLVSAVGRQQLLAKLHRATTWPHE